MSTETLDPPATETPSATAASFDAAIEAAMSAHPDGPMEGAAAAPDAIVADDLKQAAAKPDAIAKPDAPAKVDDPAPKPGSFKALKLEKDREREEAIAALRSEYETKLAEANGKAVDVDAINKGWEEKLSAAEALKAAHEAKAAELERRVIEDYETPYALEVDPEALPVLAKVDKARSVLDMAVNSAATSLGEDQRSVDLIASNRTLFGQVIAAISTGMTPDAIHAQNLVDGLKKVGVTVATEEARAVIRDLKGAVPHLRDVMEAQQMLTAIKTKNEPNWQQTQAARYEAYRRAVSGAADVPDDAVEGDDAVIAGILKGKPELRDRLKAEADRLSAMVIGPKPGSATAAAIRATPKTLHETAVRAARLPVMVVAYRESQSALLAAQARVAELEARIAKDSGTVPNTGTTAPPAVKGKVNFDQRLAEIFPNR
jgi:hypothetical protein